MLEEELGRMAPDLGVIEEWKRKDADYTQRLRDLEAATAARNEARPLLADLSSDVTFHASHAANVRCRKHITLVQ